MWTWIFRLLPFSSLIPSLGGIVEAASTIVAVLAKVIAAAIESVLAVLHTPKTIPALVMALAAGLYISHGEHKKEIAQVKATKCVEKVIKKKPAPVSQSWSPFDWFRG